MAVVLVELILDIDALEVVGVDRQPGSDTRVGEAGVIAGVPLNRGSLRVAGAALIVVVVRTTIAALSK